MTFQLVVEPAAARDIANADPHYAQLDKADAFLSAIDDVFEQLTSRPLMYPAVHGDVRRALPRRFPFSEGRHSIRARPPRSILRPGPTSFASVSNGRARCSALTANRTT